MNMAAEFKENGAFVLNNLMSRISLQIAQITSSYGQVPFNLASGNCARNAKIIFGKNINTLKITNIWYWQSRHIQRRKKNMWFTKRYTELGKFIFDHMICLYPKSITKNIQM